MGEHDDDLESVVHEEAEQETDAYPDTGDELGAEDREPEEDDEEVDLDEDKSEL
jgi:hypothetical protein